MASVLQSASRESLAAATARLDDHIDASGAADLTRLSDDLFPVLGLLERERGLVESGHDRVFLPRVRESWRSEMTTATTKKSAALAIW